MRTLTSGPRVDSSRLMWWVTAGVLAFLGVLFFMVLMAPSSGAQTPDVTIYDGPVADAIVVDLPQAAAITLGSGIMAFVTGVVSPILTALSSKTTTSEGKKSIISVFIIGLLAVINVIVLGNGTFEPWQVVLVFCETITVHVVSWIMLWKPAKAGGAGAPGLGILRG